MLEQGEIDVSIIVPIYNAEKYLEQCISSILNQTCRNIEVILVNDGSTDRSGQICKKYATFDPRVKIVDRENQGVVSARKSGSEIASGKYLGFVDADDFVDPDYYQRLIECSDDCDLVVARWVREEKGHTRLAYDKFEPGVYRTQEEMDYLLRHLINVSLPGGAVNVKSGLIPYMMTKLYRADIAREIFQVVDKTLSWGEDQEFTFRYILKCSSVKITDVAGYHYRVRENSAAHSVNQKCTYLYNVCRLYEDLLPVFQSDPRRDILLPQLQFKFTSLIMRAPSKMGFPLEAQVDAVMDEINKAKSSLRVDVMV